MHIDYEKIKNRFDELIMTGESLFARYKRIPSEHRKGADDDEMIEAQQWTTSVRSLLASLGKDSVPYEDFQKVVNDNEKYTLRRITLIQGVLKSAKENYEGGYLFEIRDLITANIFNDLLEQSEYLVKHKFSHAAIVLAGCVLEDGLRRLCRKNDIDDSLQGISNMAIELVKKEVFTELVRKQIEPSAHLRNEAAHGKRFKFKKEEAIGMIKNVRKIMAEHFY